MAIKKRPIPPPPRPAPGTDRADDFYTRLRARVTSWADRNQLKPAYREALLALPDLVHLVSRLLIDRRVDAVGKAMLGVALAYAISPIDIIPDVLGPVGFLDDLLVIALALDQMLKRAPRAVVDTHWAGSGDVQGVVDDILAKADQWLGRGLYRRIRDFMSSSLGDKAAAVPPPLPAKPARARRPAARPAAGPATRAAKGPATRAAKPAPAVARRTKTKPAVGAAKPKEGAVRKPPVARSHPKSQARRSTKGTTPR